MTSTRHFFSLRIAVMKMKVLMAECVGRFDSSTYSDWIAGVNEACSFNLAQQLLTRNEETKLITVNFDPQVWSDSWHCSRVVCGAGSMKQSSVRPSVRLSVPSFDRRLGVRRVCCSAGKRYWSRLESGGVWAPTCSGAATRGCSTALSSKCE